MQYAKGGWEIIFFDCRDEAAIDKPDSVFQAIIYLDSPSPTSSGCLPETSPSRVNSLLSDIAPREVCQPMTLPPCR